MKCDKCGFEHNSRSVCPKCGARVVFVNEDYLRRRKEWEEAQKQGMTDGMLPPGIMHSTREEYDAKNGRDRSVTYKDEGGPETASLSLAVIKDYALKLWNKLSGFIKKHRPKRGRDNSVIRELKFDDSLDTPDTSKLVVSHKIYKNRLKWPAIGLAAAAVIAAGVIIPVNIVKNIDRSNIFFFDGNKGYMATDTQKAVLETAGKFSVYDSNSRGFIASGETGIFIYTDGKCVNYPAESPVILSCSKDFNQVLYLDGNTPKIISSGETVSIPTDSHAGFTDACAVSDNGKYFVLTAYDNIDDNDVYTMYCGNESGETNVFSKDNQEKEIVFIDDDGKLVYLDMETARYGIVNNKTLMMNNISGDNEESVTIAEEVESTEYFAQSDTLYYLTEEGRLFMAGGNNLTKQVLVDSNVLEITANSLTGNSSLLYEKENGYYLARNNGENTFLFSSDRTTPEIYYHDGDSYVVYVIGNTLYRAGFSGKSEEVSGLSENSGIYYMDNENCYIGIDDNNVLFKITDKKETIAEQVTGIVECENFNGLMYIRSGKLCRIKKLSSKEKVLISDIGSVERAAFSRGKYYFTDSDSVLWEVSGNGKEKNNLGKVEKWLFME